MFSKLIPWSRNKKSTNPPVFHSTPKVAEPSLKNLEPGNLITCLVGLALTAQGLRERSSYCYGTTVPQSEDCERKCFEGY